MNPSRARRVPNTPRPLISVLAGVNGAGKSSLLSKYIHTEAKAFVWFNPDEFARELADETGMELARANGDAWNEGLRRLRKAIDQGREHAFETTLGGNTIREELIRAAASHDLHMLYCGLPDVDTHLHRIALRVAHGGHPIPEEKVRERFVTSPRNLITLMPHLTSLNVYDNSAEASPDGIAPDPKLLLMFCEGELVYPKTPKQLAQTPNWAKPIMMATLELLPNPFNPPAA